MPAWAHLADHHIAGKATVPAVELMELLARAVGDHEGWGARPPLPLGMGDVVFPRFLPADEIDRCTFQVEMARVEAGVRASLHSRIDLPGGMQRSREHAAATFTHSASVPPRPTVPLCDYEVEAERLYSELIPFGPRYRNLQGTIGLGRTGGIGLVRSPASPSASERLLGCPYLLDAAMHLACVWGQRYGGFIAYPTALSIRLLVAPIAAGQRRCLVIPRRFEARQLLCDIWLDDEQGKTCEVVTALAMSPLSAGTTPPAWIIAGGNAP
jgi:hypothetical protein